MKTIATIVNVLLIIGNLTIIILSIRGILRLYQDKQKLLSILTRAFCSPGVGRPSATQNKQAQPIEN